MLILERKLNERILIGDDIVVTLVAARNGKVRLAVEAPREVTILRQEVFERQQKAKELANGLVQ
ncbi:hypothetical protein VN12_19835 [Pirellula sp. SH-Sr6A]|uniref:carbon storage regulator n=1 Tax=Pirellula sp. SH-Sr6A TaxID=1632865 RepID=UPI00078D65FF|nr:carbon storage regulator [Pirellula sp. SH-Sr6A]AMV34386.1 hypothetical protein VN12_19835 [Pirellula sp. SH-Sr6A]